MASTTAFRPTIDWNDPDLMLLAYRITTIACYRDELTTKPFDEYDTKVMQALADPILGDRIMNKLFKEYTRADYDDVKSLRTWYQEIAKV